MKTYRLKSTQNEPDTKTLWESFVAYMDAVYFEGAADEMESELVKFEYENYTHVYSK